MLDQNHVKAAVDSKDKLQLLDLRSMDEDSLPKLRASQSLESSPTADAAVRDQAAKDWQAIQAQPEDVTNARKEVALAREQLRNTLQEKNNLKLGLQNARKQLEAERAQRLHNPLVYGMGAALLGVTGLWLYQRRKNLVNLQSQNLGKFSFGVEVKPNSRPVVDDLLKYKESEFASAPNTISSLETQPRPLHSPWYKKLLGSKSVDPIPDKLLPDTHRENESNCPDSTDTHIASSFYGDLSDSEYSDPEFVKDEILAHSTLLPADGQSTISYLYELRATVQTLTTIEQEDSARDLLLRHIDALPNTSAWAYLEYLSLCSSSDEREAFETMRQRFRVQFNRLAPYWMESPDSQRDLLGHERAIAEITAVWPSQRALVLIENWLTDSAQERRIFHLSVYDDLFDLYDILTQLEEVQDELDFLPTVSLLDLDFEFAMDFKLEAEPEGTARAVPTVKTGDFDVDFNIAFSQSLPAAIETKQEAPQMPHKDLL